MRMWLVSGIISVVCYRRYEDVKNRRCLFENKFYFDCIHVIEGARIRELTVTPQNVIIAAKCNTNAKCNNNRRKM